MSTHTGILIQNATLVTPHAVVSRGYIHIKQDRIAAMGEGYAPQHLAATSSVQIIDATHKVVLPGFTNAHTHLEQTFMRGYSANRSLLDWLKNVIWKLQAAMTVEDVELAATLGIVEAMRGGATTIINHHKVPLSPRHTNVVLQAADKLGVRMVLARAWADQGTNAEQPDSIKQDLQRLFAEWHGAAHGRIHIANGPLVPWRCSAKLLQETTVLANRHNAITHCHINETQSEVAMTLKETGLRPIEWFDSLGILSHNFHAVHGVWLSDQEIKALAKHDSLVTHCPAANMILASGVAPIQKLKRSGVRVALASDGPASNDGQDMFEMMRLAALLSRVSTMDAQATPPQDALAMATQDNVLTVGAKADLILVDLNAAHIQPVGNVLAALVYNARGSDVDTVIVDGHIRMQNKRMLGIDEIALLDECRARAAHLAKRAGVI